MFQADSLLQNRYRIVRLLAQGGMGAVFEATDERLGHTVAVKQTFFSDEYLQKAFEREAKLLARLHHPAMPRVTDYFADPKGHFLVMDFVPGLDLNQLLDSEKKPFPTAWVLDWADELCDVLEYLHAQTPPVIHRDIKPGNIKLTERGNAMLLDFGLAKGLQSQVGQTALHSVKAFTGAYAPIEQVQGIGTDPRSDVFSLGATLHHLLTGKLPPDVFQRGKAIFEGKTDPLPSVNALNSAVPEPIADAILGALALNRGERPPSATAFRKLLREASAHFHNRATAEDLKLSTDVLQAWLKRAHEDGLTEKTTRPIEIHKMETVASATGSPDISDWTTVVGSPSPGSPSPSGEHRVVPVQDHRTVEIETRRKPTTETGDSAGETLQLGAAPVFVAPSPPHGRSGATKRETPSPALFSELGNRATERKRLVVVGLVFAVLCGVGYGIFQRPQPPPSAPEQPDVDPIMTIPREGFTNRLGMEFILVPAGRFVMGSNDNAAETPPREVTIARPFFIGKFEVTQSQWKAVMGKNPSYWVGPDLPVESVSWNDAGVFLKKLNTEKDGYRYRLPTEAEWEYACRAGTTGDYSGDLKTSAWYAESRGGNIHPVGKKRPNAFGLHDMHGNVAEWCEDWFHRNYDGAPVDGAAWTTSPEQPFRIVRGGSWYESADRCRSAARNWTAPQTRGIYIGFRVVAEKSNQDVSPQGTQGTQGN